MHQDIKKVNKKSIQKSSGRLVKDYNLKRELSLFVTSCTPAHKIDLSAKHQRFVGRSLLD